MTMFSTAKTATATIQKYRLAFHIDLIVPLWVLLQIVCSHLSKLHGKRKKEFGIFVHMHVYNVDQLAGVKRSINKCTIDFKMKCLDLKINCMRFGRVRRLKPTRIDWCVLFKVGNCLILRSLAAFLYVYLSSLSRSTFRPVSVFKALSLLQSFVWWNSILRSIYLRCSTQFAVQFDPVFFQSICDKIEWFFHYFVKFALAHPLATERPITLCVQSFSRQFQFILLILISTITITLRNRCEWTFGSYHSKHYASRLDNIYDDSEDYANQKRTKTVTRK